MSNTLPQALFEEMTTDVTLSALVGTRVFPDEADQRTVMPYIVYQEFANLNIAHFSGPDSLNKASYQFTIWASSMSSRHDVENALRILFNIQRRNFGTGANEIFVNRSENTNNQSTKETPDDGSQNTRYGKFMDFEFWHERGIT